MGAPSLKIGRKILGPRNQKIEIKPLTLEKSIIIEKRLYRPGDEATDEAKTDHYTACITKEIHTIGQEIVQF
jgi:hypothetical protein